MTNTGKMLIIGLLVIDLGVAGYLLFPKEERPAAATGTVIRSATTAAGFDPRSSEAHVAAGSVVRTAPPVSGTDNLAAPPPSPDTTVAPTVTLAPDSGQVAKQAANGPWSATGTIASAEVQPSAHAKPKPAPHVEPVHAYKHDEPHRDGSNSVSAAMTAQLVKESAKPDPSLPLPPNSGSGPTTGRGSNPVASAMTDQLVRQSSKVNTPPQGR